jgi:LPS export ABC transporter protein LptC
MALIIIQGVGFQTKWLEFGQNRNAPIDAASLMDPSEGEPLATGIPADRAPDYAIQQFAFISTLSGKKEWRVVSEEALLYKEEGVNHLKKVRAWIYSPSGEATEVTALEGKYSQSSNVIELFGSVVARLPDGFIVKSDYLLHDPTRKTIEFPIPWPIEGDGRELKTTQRKKNGGFEPNISFTAVGGNVQLKTGQVQLYSQVILTLDRRDAPRPETAIQERRPTPTDRKFPGIPDRTLVASDRALLFKKEKRIHFSMAEQTPLPKRFVRVLQPRTYARGRKATADFADDLGRLHWLSLDDDVLIKERAPAETEESLKQLYKSAEPNAMEVQYITAGRAEFDTDTDQVIFKVFPQAYQGESTLTGDWMILHRDTDIIEVANGNAFNSGGP